MYERNVHNSRIVDQSVCQIRTPKGQYLLLLYAGYKCEMSGIFLFGLMCQIQFHDGCFKR